MQITIHSIINNLLSVQSDDLMKQHLADERFSSVWSSFMACRFLSWSPLAEELLPAMNSVAEVKDPKVAYPLLLHMCKEAKASGKSTRPGVYGQSPFTD